MRIKAIVTGVLFAVSALASTQTLAIETITYYHNDLLGSPVAATDAEGGILWRKAYRPYGSELDDGGVAADGAVIGYTGHRLDKDLNLVYAGARYYDPVIGRFMGMDPVGFQENSVHSFNKYAYANNNPYKYVDPNGEFAFLVFIAAAAGTFFTLNGAVEAYNANDSVMDSGISPDGARAAAKSLAIDGAITVATLGTLSFAGPFVRGGLSRFTKNADGRLDDALAQYNTNDIHHLFGRGGDATVKLLDEFGSSDAALKELQKAAQSIANKNYQTGSWVTVMVGDTPVSFKGKVIDGVFRISAIAKEEF